MFNIVNLFTVNMIFVVLLFVVGLIHLISIQKPVANVNRL